MTSGIADNPGPKQQIATGLVRLTLHVDAAWPLRRSQTCRTPLTYSTSLVYCLWMVFIESPIFTADVKELLSDEEYAALQDHLANRPDAGDVITQTGGLRKVRWRVNGSGKRGGVRVIYYHVVAQAQIRMILIYRKGVKDNLTPKEKAVLRKMNAEW